MTGHGQVETHQEDVEKFFFEGRNLKVEMVGAGEVGCCVFKTFRRSK